VASETACTFLTFFNVFFKIQKTRLFTFFELFYTFSRMLVLLYVADAMTERALLPLLISICMV